MYHRSVKDGKRGLPYYFAGCWAGASGSTDHSTPNLSRYFRNRSASLALALRPRVALKSRRPRRKGDLYNW
jgi:hypothetical protein